jgi:bifunctional non-homologous end joining protein LigD
LWQILIGFLVSLRGFAVMRRSNWTPSIVPKSDDQAVYLVVDDLGRNGRVWREADEETTDLESVIGDLVKFDGYRVQVHLANATVKIFTRRGNDWTKRFKKIAGDAWHINAGSAIIDGEVIVPSENGVSDFSVLQNELRGKSNKLVLYAFDLLYLNGLDLQKVPLFERKALLRKMIAKTDILFSESFETDGAAMFKQACNMGLEGVVSKSRDSRYNSGRGNDWVRVTCRQRETLPIAGFALKESRFDGLYIGRQKGNELIYAGKVDHGFDRATAEDLQVRLKPLIRKTQPYSRKIAHGGVGVEPSLLAEVEYRAKSAAGKVRHPLFKGIREDL